MHPYGFLIHSLAKAPHYSYFIKLYIHFQADSCRVYFKIKATIRFSYLVYGFQITYLSVQLLPYYLFLEKLVAVVLSWVFKLLLIY